MLRAARLLTLALVLTAAPGHGAGRDLEPRPRELLDRFVMALGRSASAYRVRDSCRKAGSMSTARPAISSQ
jgi:hypothetical protein